MVPEARSTTEHSVQLHPGGRGCQQAGQGGSKRHVQSGQNLQSQHRCKEEHQSHQGAGQGKQKAKDRPGSLHQKLAQNPKQSPGQSSRHHGEANS